MERWQPQWAMQARNYVQRIGEILGGVMNKVQRCECGKDMWLWKWGYNSKKQKKYSVYFCGDCEITIKKLDPLTPKQKENFREVTR